MCYTLGLFDFYLSLCSLYLYILLLLITVCYYYINVSTKNHWNKEKESFFFLLHISNVNNLCFHEAWNWGVIFKCTDDHIFEKTMKTELACAYKISLKFLTNETAQFLFLALSQSVGEIRISCYFSRKNVTFRTMSF
jgi:hypothetical protein